MTNQNTISESNICSSAYDNYTEAQIVTSWIRGGLTAVRGKSISQFETENPFYLDGYNFICQYKLSNNPTTEDLQNILWSYSNGNLF